MQSFTKIIIAFVMLSSSASAQTFTQAGTTELGGDITYASITSPIDGSSGSVFSFSPYLGFMAGSGFEFGMRPSLMVEDGFTEFSFYFAPSYNINTHTNVYPYVELLAGYNSMNSGDQGQNGLGLGFDGGLKVAIGGSSLLLIKFEHVHNSYSANPNAFDEGSVSLSTVTFGIGFRVFLGRETKASSPTEKK